MNNTDNDGSIAIASFDANLTLLYFVGAPFDGAETGTVAGA
jgi:hypothetical protein